MTTPRDKARQAIDEADRHIKYALDAKPHDLSKAAVQAQIASAAAITAIANLLLERFAPNSDD